MNISNRTAIVTVGLSTLGTSLLVARHALKFYQKAVKLDTLERSDLQRLVSPVAALFTPQSDEEAKELRGQLTRAGMRDDDAVKSFNYLRAQAMLGALAAALVTLIAGGGLAMFAMTSLVLLYLAYKLPLVWLTQRVALRQQRIERALPALIDLMVLCLDVGLSTESAFEKVTHEMQSLEPLMAEESRQMIGEMSAGVTFPQALKRMSDRVGVEEMITMARLISQASGLGASITTTLREYSEASQTKRMLQLEEKAGKVSAFLVMPLIACLLPASILALIGPAVLTLIKNLGL